MKRSRWLGHVVALLVLSSLPAVAGPHAARPDSWAFQFRFGGFFPEADSDFWSTNQDLFTLDDSDFDDAVVGLTFVSAVTNHLEVGFNVDFYDKTVVSAERGFVDEFGFPILHDTRLQTMPMIVDLRVIPGGRFGVRGSRGQHRVRQPVFYLGGGLGVNYWEYEEIGDFVDDSFDPPEIFFDRLQDDGFAFAAQALAGLELPLGHSWSLLFEGRYTWSDDDLGDDLAGFGTLDLDGAAVYVGFSVRH